MTPKSIVLAAALLFAPLNAVAQGAPINVIPQPLEVQTGSGTFTFNAQTQLAWKGKESKGVADYLRSKLAASTGQKFDKKGKVGAPGTISLVIDKAVSGPEHYTLSVTPDHVTARAATAQGLFYAVQTLLQLMPAEVEQTPATNFTEWAVPAVSIDDEPRFAYRGVMLDPCRHFLPVSAVKKQIDLLASYKINRLHWHLTEDQGWRIEIKKYPELTSVGSKRVEGDGSIHQGFYTQDEIREVVRYAAERHVEVIPELEIPGHELAAIAAYPELSCREESTTPRIIWGVEDVVMCPGKEKMFNFLNDVIDEMVELFPSRYFHIGGDESPRGEWQKCTRCQARMKEQGLTNEAQLQSYVIARIEKHLRSKGKTIIGWDEILEGGNLDTTSIVMSWRGEQGGIAAAKAGHHVIMTPSSHGLYFDQFQGDIVTEPSCAIGGYAPLEKVYAYDPVPAEVSAAGRADMVMGLQANCWSEYLPSPSMLEYRLWPRALALAEVGWTALSRKDWSDFSRRVDTDAALRLEARHVNFHIPQPEQPGGSCNNLAFTDTLSVALRTTRPLTIVYTTDGTQPTPQSPRYESPILLNRTTTLRTAAVLPCGIMSPVRTIYADRQPYAPAVTTPSQPAPGLLLSKWEGTYQRPSQVTGRPAVSDSVVADISALRTLAHVPANVRGVKNYYAAVEGYVDIPADGVYEFRTNNNQLFIDDKCVVDNSLVAVPRYSTKGSQVALARGLHKLRVTFMGGIFGGWPTWWDDAKVSFRPAGGSWQSIPADMLKH